MGKGSLSIQTGNQGGIKIGITDHISISVFV